MSAARTARQVIALAGGTFREAVRMKAFAAAAVFAATAVALSPFLPSDGTPGGAVRLAVSVSLLTATIFGTFTAVMLAALIPARETRDRTGLLLATKPVPRWGLFAGRALGLSGVLAAMFAGMAALSWAFVRYAAAREGSAGGGARIEAEEALAVRAEVRPTWETGPVREPSGGPAGATELAPGARLRWVFALPPSFSRLERFDGRVTLGPGVPAWPEGLVVSTLRPDGERVDVGSLEAERLAAGWRFSIPREHVWFEHEDTGRPGTAAVEVENRSAAPVPLAGPWPVVLLLGTNVSVAPGGTYEWRFDLPRGATGPAFRFRASRAMMEIQEVEIELRGAAGAGPVTRRTMPGRGSAFLIEVPEGFVPEYGRVEGTLRNVSMDGVRLPVGTGLVFAPRAGTFAGALARWAAVETAKAVFLIVLVTAGAMALSFPIPALLGGAAAAGGYLVSFVIALTMAGDRSAWALVFEGTLRAVLPDFAGATTAGSVAGGDLVPAWFVLKAVLLLVVVRGGVVAALGGWLAARREVGA